MARLPGKGVRIGGKVKLGTTVLPSTVEALKRVQKAFPEIARTQGEAVDLLVSRVLSLKSKEAAFLYESCNERIDGLEAQENLAFREESRLYEFATVVDRKDALVDFAEFIRTIYGVSSKVQSNMGKIWLANRDYVTLPEDYLLINPDDARSCSDVGIIEVRGGSKYSAPHFAFFTDGHEQLSKLEQEQLQAEATNLWPPLKQVIDDQVPLEKSLDGRMLNEEEHLAAPEVCFFNVLDADVYDRMGIGAPGGIAIYRANRG